MTNRQNKLVKKNKIEMVRVHQFRKKNKEKESSKKLDQTQPRGTMTLYSKQRK